MPEEKHLITDSKGNPYTILVQRDRRLKKSARWVHQSDGTIVLRVPYRTPQRQIGPLLDSVARSVERQMRRRDRSAGRTDADLQARAEHLNRTCFDGQIQWSAIRWVDNMEKRLGSCTNGGPTDGHIRISERIKEWPRWVVDYVIAHELAHRVHSDHGRAFWKFLRAAYPLTERARGFIDGMGYARGEHFEEDESAS